MNMIILAIVIVLVVLIIANLALSLFNKISPPCNTVDDYFRSARLLPDGKSASLGSIPSGTDINYIGAKIEESDRPNSVTLTSRNGDYTDESIDKSELSDSVFSDAVNKIFSNPNGDSMTNRKKKNSSYKGENIAMFDENEGITANLNHVNTDRRSHKPSAMMGFTDRDGYKDRKPDDW